MKFGITGMLYCHPLAASLALTVLLGGCGASTPPDSATSSGKTIATAANGPASIAHVRYADSRDLNRLIARYDWIEQMDPKAQTVALLLTEPEHQALVLEGYAVSIDRIATERLRTKALLASQTRPAFQQAGITGFPCYRTVEETYDALYALQSSHPDLAEIVDFGDSWAKANPLPLAPYGAGHDLLYARLTNRTISGPKPVFLLYAATHAREYATAELATRFAESLVNAYGIDPDITWILDYSEVHVIPQGNPDARKFAEQGLYWRKNVNPNYCPILAAPGSFLLAAVHQGVDLNRNSSFMWGFNGVSSDPVSNPTLEEGSSSNFCSEQYRGPSAASEPETLALEAHMQGTFPDRRGPELNDAAPNDSEGLFITIHSNLVSNLYPWGFTVEQAAPNETALHTFTRKLSYYNQYPAPNPLEFNLTVNGAHDDYSYGELGVASFTVELDGTDFFQDCTSFEATTLPDNLQALRYAAKTTRRPYQTPAGPESLDVQLIPATVTAGMPVMLTARADDTRYIASTGNEIPEAVQPVAAARYSVGLPSWRDGSKPLALDAADGAFDDATETLQARLNTAGLAPGRHLVFVESLDTDGSWGVPTAVFLEILR